MAWQLFFVRDTPVTMWVSMILLLGALIAFAITLLSLYRCVRNRLCSAWVPGKSTSCAATTSLLGLPFANAGPAADSLSSA